ncbi:right-handed parallel beta-helix repeat-containing protein [Neisseria sicca]|jgi:hypothetical protein|uniref:right-handed parallel beta-helix repeat-containing protein n=2 Tax=Neisseria TaxID=482 RepID=UPI000D31CC43|nr:right-handed parallel beta-helix repeat-containing protein [Neisseria sicca]MBF1284750.1 right-handed parallel beta-helix repeat-containing protein [Neisseria sp.]
MSSKTTHSFFNLGQTKVHTRSQTSQSNHAVAKSQDNAGNAPSALNKLIYDHSFGGLNLAAALPKQLRGQDKILGLQNTSFADNTTSKVSKPALVADRSKLTSKEMAIMSQALRADAVARKQAEAQAAKEQLMAKYQAARQAAVAAAAARHAEAMEKAKAAAAARQAEAVEKAKAASAARQAEALEKSKAAHAAKQAEIAAKTKAILAEKQAAEKAQHTETDVAHNQQTSGKTAYSANTVTVAHKHEDNQVSGNKEAARHNTSKPNAAHIAKQAENHVDQQDDVKEEEVFNYTVHQSKEFGKYINVDDFGADPTGKKDSLAAIKAALNAAHKEKAMLFMDGTYYISDQIVINGNNSGVKGIFGSGMGKTLITFDKAQVGVFNPNTNHDDIRAFAGILVDGQNHKTIANLSVKYTNSDFYRKGLSYFGKVSGILVNDADHTLISKVEVSGANRAGVMFTSTDALVREAGKSQTYKARVQSGEINEQYDHLPLGENNRIVDSYLHHNRVAGAMVGYQKNFVGEGNRLEWNGHEADGGTGYGMTAMAGSYNYGITFRNNTTDHNYRKGLDVHDGTGIVIENNVLNGDRLYGIAAYNRQFSMDNVKIKGNVITQDPNFRLYMDDDLGKHYHMYSGIQVQTNTQLRDLHTADKGYYDISGNTIKNLAVYQNNIQTYGIEFRNHESKMDYTLNITDNKIDGDSTKYLMAVINNTYDHVNKHNGIGTGTINISDNTANIGKIAPGAVPFYIEEHRSEVPLHGSVTLNNNDITVREESAGYREFAYMRTNAKEYNVTNNTLSLHGKLNDAIVDVNSTGDGAGKATLNVANNTLHTDIKGKLYATWLKHEADIDTFAGSNTHNGDQLKDVNTTGKDIALSDVLGHVHNKVEAIHDTVYANHPKYPTMIDDQAYHSGIL